MRYFLHLAYDGTPFHGWQRQPNASSVQETIEKALKVVTRQDVEIVGAGRTDAGVHARQMFAHFDLEEVNDVSRFLSSLNKLVGPSIALYELLPVNPQANARFDAIERTYSYYITLKKDPFSRNFFHRLHRLPDIDKMNEAASILLHTSDFTSFAKLHSDTKTNICEVSRASWELFPNEERIVFTITADRFLRNMVRSVVGTLLEVGLSKLSIEQFVKIIEDKNRCSAGVSMPASGLFLEKIKYPPQIFI